MSDPEAEKLMHQYGGIWGEHPIYGSDRWRYAVACGDTRSGYWSWVVAQLEEDAVFTPTGV